MRTSRGAAEITPSSILTVEELLFYRIPAGMVGFCLCLGIKDSGKLRHFCWEAGNGPSQPEDDTAVLRSSQPRLPHLQQYNNYI